MRKRITKEPLKPIYSSKDFENQNCDSVDSCETENEKKARLIERYEQWYLKPSTFSPLSKDELDFINNELPDCERKCIGILHKEQEEYYKQLYSTLSEEDIKADLFQRWLDIEYDPIDLNRLPLTEDELSIISDLIEEHEESMYSEDTDYESYYEDDNCNENENLVSPFDRLSPYEDAILDGEAMGYEHYF